MPVSRSSVTILDGGFKPTNVEEYLDFLVADTVRRLVDELERADKDQPGNLIQSIGENTFVERQGDKITFQIGMNDYWKFVDKGVDGTERKHGSKYKYKNDGKPINLQAVKDFIAARGIQLKKKAIPKVKNKKIKKTLKKISREKAQLSAAFAIGRTIKKKGIKPTHFYTNVVNDNYKKMVQQNLASVLKKDVQIFFKELNEELK